MKTDNNKKWDYLAGRSLSVSTNNGYFYCLDCFHSFRSKNVLKNMKIYAKTTTVFLYKCLIKTIIY